MRFESARRWSNVVYVVGIAVLLVGCAEFLISRAYPSGVGMNTAVSMVLLIIGAVTTLIGFGMRKIVRDIAAETSSIQHHLHELRKKNQ